MPGGDTTTEQEPSHHGSEGSHSPQHEAVPESPVMMTKSRGVGRGWVVVLSCCLLLAGLSLLTSGLVSWSLTSPPAERFLILLDAGSVHTSVYTYRYSFPEPANVTVRETHYCDLGEIGISSFQDNPSEAAVFVSSSPCVRNSVERIPEDKRPLSRLELLSTAGMRVVRLKSPAVAQQILGNLTHQLGQIGDMAASVNILSGVEEAVAGWVTSVELSKEVMGALDWGGASSQLTLPSSEDSAGTRQVTINGEQLSVRPYSHLCYGQSESLKRHRAGLVVRSLGQGEIDVTAAVTLTVSDPCLPSNYSSTPVPLPSLFSSPCTWLTDTDLLKSLTASPAKVTFSSTQDYQECSDLVLDQFSPEKCEETWQALPGEVTCLDPSSLPPPTNLTYLAMSTYWYLMKGLKLQQGVSMPTFLQKTRHICSLNISESQAELERSVPTVCYQSLLMSHLLTTGYHFNSSSWQQIKFVKRLENTEVGWGLGHAIIDANSLPDDRPISLTVMLVLVLCGLLLLLLGLTVVVKGFLNREVYSRLRELI